MKSYTLFGNPITLKVVSSTAAISPLRVEIQPASEKTGPGLPGKQVGGIVLIQDGRGQKRVTTSLGPKDKINAEIYRQAGGCLAHWLKANRVDQVDIDTSTFEASHQEQTLSPLCEGLLLGSYEFSHRKSLVDPLPAIQINLRTSGNEQTLQAAVDRIEAIVSAVNLARDWAHEPANVINPITLAERAEELAQEYGLKCTIFDEKKLLSMGAGAIFSVGKGSKTQPRMIILEYPGQGQTAASPVILVGKAITFDTGGYSLKSVENIQGMKYDKCGGVTVAAVLMAASVLKLKQPLVGIIGAAENMISGESYRPDDILTSLSGKTIEIVSTDAEGRLVLADCLTYAQNQYHPQAVIDLATLTGGVVVALGRVRAGLFSNNDALAEKLITSGEATHERLWRLPLDDDYAITIKGDDADLKNSGGREGQPVTASVFLKQFVEDKIPWAHLDIAEVAGTVKDDSYTPKGPTGFGVRLLLNYLERLE